MRERTINLILALMTVLLVSNGPAHGFDYFEHRHLGNQAYREATMGSIVNAPSGFYNDLHQAEKKLGVSIGQNESGSNNHDLIDQIPIGFGDLSALAGDHAEDPAGLLVMIQRFGRGDNEEKERRFATRRQWVQACRWYRETLGISNTGVLRVDRCFDKFQLIPLDISAAQYPGTSKGYEPSRVELADFEKLSKYVGLAGKNRDHFPKHSWLVYLQWHARALDCAKAYRNRSPKNCAPKYGGDNEVLQALVQALLYEGFAQHFLQDSFSSGHIGTKFGSCLPEYVGVNAPLGCSPNKRIVQHTHDYLNAFGLRVKLRTSRAVLDTVEGEFKHSEQNHWTAYGDRHLFIPEGLFHRRVLESIAVKSVARVLRAAYLDEGSQTSCLDILGSLPVLVESTEEMTSDCEEIATKRESDLARWSEDRSPDPIVPDLPVEGWKFLVSWGTLYGRFTHLNEDGSSRGTRRGVTFGTIEIGYVRSTSPWIPNYLGFGTSIAPGNRFSIYPVSIGYWRPRVVGNFFGGIRLNAGVRVTEPFSVENPTTHRDDTAELNVPLDLGWEIYSPIALYLRADLLTVNFPVLPSKAVVDSIFAGRGAVTFGLRFDLAGILP